MKTFVVGFLATLICFLVLDAIWLGLLAKDIYLFALEGRLRQEYPLFPWIAFYLFYAGTITYLVVIPNLAEDSFKVAFKGAVLGCASYGAYNMTNYAIMEGWPLHITMIDLLWGTLVTAVSSLFSWTVIWRVTGGANLKQKSPEQLP